MIRADMLDQALHISTNCIHIPISTAYHTRILTIRRVAFYRKSLSKSELACFHNLGLVAFFAHGNRCPFPDHPEVVAGYIEAQTAGGTLAAAAGCHGGCERLVGDVLEVEAISTVQCIRDFDERLRGAFWWGNRALWGGRAVGGVGGKAELLILKGFKGAFACGVGGGDEFCHVGAGELAIIVEGVLEDGYDGLLEGDDLSLQLIFGYGWLGVSVRLLSAVRSEDVPSPRANRLPYRPYMSSYILCIIMPFLSKFSPTSSRYSLR